MSDLLGNSDRQTDRPTKRRTYMRGHNYGKSLYNHKLSHDQLLDICNFLYFRIMLFCATRLARRLYSTLYTASIHSASMFSISGTILFCVQFFFYCVLYVDSKSTMYIYIYYICIYEILSKKYHQTL